VAFLKICNLPE